MSETESAVEDSTEDVGGLEEILPDPLVPIYERWLLVDEFRETHGDTYTGVLEAIVGAVLIGGYVYWLYLFFVVG
ncbi:Uncharacterized protein HSRCO_2761 [Halanaeroarchaeum sp. HSR-CO]|uniref:hypothetical protein n=1 Tax=Halanaeroarchaeum sp. HSR-CO TaxID=2866382 RepID=UPI00217CC834|nr:hypothetical protein [Halanaeroarchaeum sp. HSR-CO]UWG49017.1 Uncharacterized protein HSRCO_2761 [Halanaeroarchaeum sp. HSR-CO]